MKPSTLALIGLLAASSVLADRVVKSHPSPSPHPVPSCKDYECPPHDHSNRPRWNHGEYTPDALDCKYQSGHGTVYTCRYDSWGKQAGGVTSCPKKADRRNSDKEPAPPQPGGVHKKRAVDDGTKGGKHDAKPDGKSGKSGKHRKHRKHGKHDGKK